MYDAKRVFRRPRVYVHCVMIAIFACIHVVKVYCNLRLFGKIEEIGLSDANLQWPSSDEDSG